ncbi:unnamed protein product, partial [Mesorhabditis belari]|uniref:cytochrome-b5 reductase n=1 Tax=Mesorhabditis belari TaxID=2138241 RepID=A0AAF3EFA4_9BILA
MAVVYKNCVTFRSKSDEGRFLTRQYTPSKIGNGYFEIPIKVYDDGRFSRIVATWKLGDMIDWRGPYDTEHEFNFRGMPSLLIVCGGTGIAPIPRILERIFGDERVETRVRLVCCFSDPSSVLFREEISKWTTNWNCQIACYFSRKEEEAKLPYLVEVHNERFTEVAFEEQLEKLDTLSPHPTLIVCGSLAFEKDVINYAIRQGIPSEKRIRFA